MRKYLILSAIHLGLLIGCTPNPSNFSEKKDLKVSFDTTFFENEEFYLASQESKYPIEMMRGNEDDIYIAYFEQLDIFENPFLSDNSPYSIIQKLEINSFSIDSSECYQEIVDRVYRPFVIKFGENSIIKILEYNSQDYTLVDAKIKDSSIVLLGKFHVNMTKVDFLNLIFKSIPPFFTSTHTITLSNLMSDMSTIFIFEKERLVSIEITQNKNPQWVVECFE